MARSRSWKKLFFTTELMFEGTVEDYTKVFGGGADVGDEGVRGVRGYGSAVVE